MGQKKVVIGLSGGVDSSVAAYLLKKQGYDVTGVLLQVFGTDRRGVQADKYAGEAAEGDGAGTAKTADALRLDSAERMARDAEKVARALDMPLVRIDDTKRFSEKVEDYFTGEYLQGRTPNPCVVCNRFIKWEALCAYADSIGADYVATGHYAGVRRLENGRYTLVNAAAQKKDQTYVLFELTQAQLARTLMPLAKYDKETVRLLAKEAGIPVAEKKDSQEICFIPDHDYAAFICRKQPDTVCAEGNFVTPDGEVLGRHKGLIYYTVGQRKGLGISFGEPMFVKRICPDTNEIVLVKEEDMYSDGLLCGQVNFMATEGLKPGEKLRVTGKIRYAHKGAPATITMREDGFLQADFDEPVRAVTPGQAAVFYDGDMIVCGGWILS